MNAWGISHDTMTPSLSILTDTARVQRLAVGDLAALRALERTVKDAGLPEGFLTTKSDAELMGYLTGAVGRAYAVFERGQLNAAALMRLPQPGQSNAGGGGFPRLSASDWAHRTAFMENAMVAPEARRRGLHRALVDARLADARLAAMEWLTSGARLRNPSSWYGLIASGMTLVGARTDAQGHEVVALLLPLNGRPIATDPQDLKRISRDDAQAHILALNAGYLGIGVEHGDRVIYARELT
jgi:ribosomal protein S18 acetylase RimI-like enzyme